MEGRRVLLLAASMACAITALMVGCKKGGPARPYDVKQPDLAGNLVVQVKDSQGAAVTDAIVDVMDSLGGSFEQTTNFTGTTAFNFDYPKYYAGCPDPTFIVSLPPQGHMDESAVTFVPSIGPNTILFSANPKLTVGYAKRSPTAYVLGQATTMVLNVVYDKGGNEEVPVSIVARNVPSNWGFGIGQQVLGEGVTQTPVTFIIPANEYRQPSLVFDGAFVNGGGAGIYASSNTFKISRAFSISLDVSSGVTTGASNEVWYGGFNARVQNGPNVVWNYTYTLQGGAYGNCGGGLYTFQNRSGTFTGNYSLQWTDGTHQVCTNSQMTETIHIWNSDVGDYYYNGKTGPLGDGNKAMSSSADHGNQTY